MKLTKAEREELLRLVDKFDLAGLTVFERGRIFDALPKLIAAIAKLEADAKINGDEIDRLASQLSDGELERQRLRKELAELRDENGRMMRALERLTDDNFALLLRNSDLLLELAYNRERDVTTNAELVTQLAELRAENGRLRAGLQGIADYPSDGGYPKETVFDEYAYKRMVDSYRDAARSALAARESNECRTCKGERRVIRIDGRNSFPAEDCPDCAPRESNPTNQFVCTTCRDTHEVRLFGRVMLCEDCPAPCTEFRNESTVFCATTPCGCACHSSRESKAPEIITTVVHARTDAETRNCTPCWICRGTGQYRGKPCPADDCTSTESKGGG